MRDEISEIQRILYEEYKEMTGRSFEDFMVYQDVCQYNKLIYENDLESAEIILELLNYYDYKYEFENGIITKYTKV